MQGIVFAIARALFESSRPADAHTPWEVLPNTYIALQGSARRPTVFMGVGLGCASHIVAGPKYLSFYPGEEREHDAEMIPKLAMKYASRQLMPAMQF